MRNLYNDIIKLHNEMSTYVTEQVGIAERYLLSRRYQLREMLNGRTDPFEECNEDEDLDNISVINPVANSTLRNSRPRRTAYQVAGVNIKKNLNIPSKLRRPSTGDVYNGTLSGSDNGLLKTRVLGSTTNSATLNKKQNKTLKSSDVSEPEQNRSFNNSLNDKKMMSKTVAVFNNKQSRTLMPVVEKKELNLEKAESGELPVQNLMESLVNNNNIADTPNNDENQLPESTATLKSPNLSNSSDVSKKSDTLKPTHVLTPSSAHRATTAYVNLVKLRTQQFENIASTSKQKPMPLLSSTVPAQPTSISSENSSEGGVVSRTCRATTRAMTRAISRNRSSVGVKKKIKKSGPKAVAKSRESKTGIILRANKRKQEKLQANAAEIRKQREERYRKAEAAREAKLLQAQQVELENQMKKEERLKMLAAEKEKQLIGEAKKAAIAKQKKIELEERLRKEKAAQAARLKEIEEEHKRAEAARKKKAEAEAEAAKKKKEAEAEATRKRKAEALQQKQKMNNNLPPTKANVNHVNTPTPSVKETKKPESDNKNGETSGDNNATYVVNDNNNYDMTPHRNERPLGNPKTEDDYGIDEISASDSSEDEGHPKKHIPNWAKSSVRMLQLQKQAFVPMPYVRMMFKVPSDPPKIFDHCKRTRTSSAHWN